MIGIAGIRLLLSSPSVQKMPLAPRFLPADKKQVIVWSAEMRHRGFTAEFTTSHIYLSEAVQIGLDGDRLFSWLIHMTPTGAVAVRRWPGVAQIVPTMSDALAIVTAAGG
jgi:hypothetical protein